MYDNCVKVALMSPPVDGKANAELTAFFAEIFHIAKRQVSIDAGAAGRSKRVLLEDIPAEVCVAELQKCSRAGN